MRRAIRRTVLRGWGSGCGFGVGAGTVTGRRRTVGSLFGWDWAKSWLNVTLRIVPAAVRAVPDGDQQMRMPQGFFVVVVVVGTVVVG